MPTWKGFGYAYTRWRPGLGFVFTFLTLLTTGLHYVVLRMNHTRDKRRVNYFTEAARKVASGAKGRRKVRIPMVEGSNGGETLELVVDGDTVLLVRPKGMSGAATDHQPHSDGTATPLSSLAPEPSMSRTWPVQLSRGVWARLGPKSKQEAGEDEDDYDEEEEEDVEVDGYDISKEEPGTPTPPARRSRAAELRAQRLKGSKGKGGASDATPGTSTAENTEGEGEESASASGAETSQRRKRAGGGKAAAARRRKMGAKK